MGARVLAQVPLAEPVVAAAVLVVLRPYPLLWLAAASLVGLRAAAAFRAARSPPRAGATVGRARKPEDR